MEPSVFRDDLTVLIIQAEVLIVRAKVLIVRAKVLIVQAKVCFFLQQGHKEQEWTVAGGL